MGHLVISRRIGEGVQVGDAHIKVVRAKGNRVRLYITADESVTISRDELPKKQLPMKKGDASNAGN
jgi:carbon storage regulator CsrA